MADSRKFGKLESSEVLVELLIWKIIRIGQKLERKQIKTIYLLTNNDQ